MKLPRTATFFANLTMKFLLAAQFVLAAFTAIAADAPPFAIAREGKSACAIVVADRASDRTRAAAAQLGAMLARMSGAHFEVKTGDGAGGIVVGLASDFPELAKVDALTDRAITERENYLLRSEEQRLLLLGNTELAVEDAVWDLLYRLGYRQFFPTKNWEVVPANPRLTIAVDSLERPSYYSRRIHYGRGPADFAEKTWADWCARNRANNGFAFLESRVWRDRRAAQSGVCRAS